MAKVKVFVHESHANAETDTGLCHIKLPGHICSGLLMCGSISCIIGLILQFEPHCAANKNMMRHFLKYVQIAWLDHSYALWLVDFGYYFT